MIGRDAFAAQFDVSRETIARLDTYAALLQEWQQRMNLVGPSTLPQLWTRHFTDSAQLAALGGAGRWLDIGSGGGFPGLVLAILMPNCQVTLVESIAKKCAFLREVIAATGLLDRATVLNSRIEHLPYERFDVVTARAVAPLSKLFDWTVRFAHPGLHWILPKGSRVEEELADARRAFTIEAQLVPSLTDPDARIVVATAVKRQ